MIGVDLGLRPLSSCCPAYCDTDGIMLGVIPVPDLACANATFGGKWIYCSASWMRTFELVKL